MREWIATRQWKLWSNSHLRESSDRICLSTCFPLRYSTLPKYKAISIVPEISIILWIIVTGSLCGAKSEGCHCLVLLPSQVDQTARLHGRHWTVCAILHGWRTYYILANNLNTTRPCIWQMNYFSSYVLAVFSTHFRSLVKEAPSKYAFHVVRGYEKGIH